uniref:Uncharacterized protein n=1 Tax=Glossina pallidipes TaxID=7398 RepID=A0A1B0A4V4_GLOPL
MNARKFSLLISLCSQYVAPREISSYALRMYHSPQYLTFIIVNLTVCYILSYYTSTSEKSGSASSSVGSSSRSSNVFAQIIAHQSHDMHTATDVDIPNKYCVTTIEHVRESKFFEDVCMVCYEVTRHALRHDDDDDGDDDDDAGDDDDGHIGSIRTSTDCINFENVNPIDCYVLSMRLLMELSNNQNMQKDMYSSTQSSVQWMAFEFSYGVTSVVLALSILGQQSRHRYP